MLYQRVLIPDEGDAWRVVIEYHRAETRIFRALTAVLRMFKLRTKPMQTFELMGPETKRDDG